MAVDNEQARLMLESALEMGSIVARAATATATECMARGDTANAKAFLAFSRLIIQHGNEARRLLAIPRGIEESGRAKELEGQYVQWHWVRWKSLTYYRPAEVSYLKTGVPFNVRFFDDEDVLPSLCEIMEEITRDDAG